LIDVNDDRRGVAGHVGDIGHDITPVPVLVMGLGGGRSGQGRNSEKTGFHIGEVDAGEAMERKRDGC
jgi:hypothetical protein